MQYIEEREDDIVIGAMTPLWQIKISPVIQEFAGGAISKAISDVADKNVQRYGTLGGVISGKAPFPSSCRSSCPSTSMYSCRIKAA